MRSRKNVSKNNIGEPDTFFCLVIDWARWRLWSPTSRDYTSWQSIRQSDMYPETYITTHRTMKTETFVHVHYFQDIVLAVRTQATAHIFRVRGFHQTGKKRCEPAFILWNLSKDGMTLETFFNMIHPSPLVLFTDPVVDHNRQGIDG